MKLVSFYAREHERAGLLCGDTVYEIGRLYQGWPVTMQSILDQWDYWYPKLRAMNASLTESKTPRFPYHELSGIELVAPLPHPGSCRDAYAFRQHVETARRNRYLPMIPAFDQFPVFYFTNHRSVQGPGNIHCLPDHFSQLDFELEAAIVIGKKGKNIPAHLADQYIAGITVMNDVSARTLQLEEMLLNLGPAKGKDFATVTGPALVTLDELSDREVNCRQGHTGKSWNLSMKAFVNGVQVSQGNLSEMDWTFAEIIERASYGVTLYPGDIIGSGTVGTGCFLELNGTARLVDPLYTERWLVEHDKVDLFIERLGTLSNNIVGDTAPYSLLEKKKQYGA